MRVHTPRRESAANTWIYIMKKTISMLFTCALALTACGPEDSPAPTPTPTPAPKPAPAQTCQKPRGNYMLTGTVTQVSPASTCPQPEVGGDRSAAVPLKFDVTGKLVSAYETLGMMCTTTYSNNDCTVKTTCSTTFDDGVFGEEHVYNLSADGLVLRGYYIMTGTGVYCPRIVVEGVAQYTP